ncbi:MAG TPA: glycosyltransferase [Candidatus Binataceae bacterium]|nr:glycosyltransferase [Candidatus Binataceae bacterium]
MRLLHIHSGNLYGGVETLMLTLTREGYRYPALQGDFALCYEGRLANELRAAEAKVHLLGEARARNPISLLAARRRLRQILVEGAYDAAVTHMPWAQALFGKTVRAGGLPLVFWMHDAASGRSWLERWAARTRPDLVLCNSDYTASTLKLLYPGARAETVAYPVATEMQVLQTEDRAAIREELHTRRDATVIIQTSRMEAWKGHELHLRALARLRDLPGWTVWFVGGAQRPVEQRYQMKLRRIAADLEIAERVHFPGHRSDVPRLLKAADIYGQPNQGPEPFGIVFIEALAAGLPVVSVDFGGAREIVDRNCGALVPPDDAEALAAVLRRLITDPLERQRMGNSGPARARILCDPAMQMSRIERAISSVTCVGSRTANQTQPDDSRVPTDSLKPVNLSNTVAVPPPVSVVIATYNGAARLPRVLAALAAQDSPDGSFEVIVVDNASTDDTALVATSDPSVARMALRAIRCRTVSESRQGVLFARIKGVLEAMGHLVCFVDDDNIPQCDFVRRGLSLFTDESKSMAIARVSAKWEVEPSPSVYRRRHLFAVNDYSGEVPFEFLELIAATITAGMWLRREAFLNAIPWQTPERLMVGREGNGLGGGEDIEFGVLFALAGYRRFYEPSLRIQHEISRYKLAENHVKRLISGTIRSEMALRAKYEKPFGGMERAAAWTNFAMTACMLPALPLVKADWKREAKFILADRYAHVIGPISLEARQ